MSNNKALTVALGPILTINSNWRMSEKNAYAQNYPCLIKKKQTSGHLVFNGKLMKSNV